MTIDELNALTALTASDEIPVWDSEESGEPTKKITAQNMANSVKTLANLQGALTFDTTPTTGSTNPVTSGGVANAITQSTAITNVKSLLTVAGDWCEVRYAYRAGNVVYIQLWVAAGTTSGKTLATISNAIRPVIADYCVPCLYEQAGTVANSTAWIEHADVSKITYYGDTSTAVTRVSLMYFTE